MSRSRVVTRHGAAAPRERGAALVFVLLVMLALVALGHGALASALGELAASRAVARQLEVRAAAEAAVSLALREPGGAWTDSIAVGEVRALGSRTLGRAVAAPGLRRIGPEAWLAEGEGRLGPRARARAARLVWAMDPLTRVTALGGAVNVGWSAAVSLAGAVDATAPARVDPPLVAGDCAPWLTELDSHYLAAPLATAALLPDTATDVSLGLLDLDALLTLADAGVAGTGTPSPVERLGVCVIDEPGGWGDPDRPGGPCGPHLPVRASLGDLTVEGGAGQGVLAVGGDLTLSAARYYGLVVVRGALRLEDGALLEGLALALGGATVASDARIVASACWAVRALAAARGALGLMLPAPGVAPIGPL